VDHPDDIRRDTRWGLGRGLSKNSRNAVGARSAFYRSAVGAVEGLGGEARNGIEIFGARAMREGAQPDSQLSILNHRCIDEACSVLHVEANELRSQAEHRGSMGIMGARRAARPRGGRRGRWPVAWSVGE